MKKICVYTCITGNYDNLHEVSVKEKNVDYLCFTNNKELRSNTWKIIYIDQDGLDNQRLSRKIKMLGHPIISENYDISVWMDASVVFKKSIKKFVSTFLKKNAFAAFKHAYRNCIYDEALECIKLRKDKKEKILETIDFLKSENYPINNGLCEMTVFIKKHNDEIVIKTMKLWFDMICKYSKRDQLSFMYCAWKTKLKLDIINLSVWDNEWFSTNNHNYSKNIKDYRIYYGVDTGVNYDYNLDEQNDYIMENNKYSINTIIPVETDTIVVELTNVPCVRYKNLEVLNKSLTDISYFNTIEFNGNNIFYNDRGIIQLFGKFKKNQKLIISIEFEKLSEVELFDFISYLSTNNIIQKNDIQVLKTKTDDLDKEIDILKAEIDGILESKSWKITKPIRLLSKLSKRK